MLTSKQRAYLRSIANTLPTLGQIGKDGVTDNVVRSAESALAAREIIKLRVLETAMMTAREACTVLCEELGAEPVQCIGTRFVIYKKSDEHSTIVLPK